ncbi:3-methyl-2-oxobutanoate hydroxymethyltransferase [Orrella sp. NBD-18]|uniref:3-methyl-2-oxobutanoate hydroxymethyltransferase n=1 Tax=Sheuella amnicola TaxID=2707330 RepID=A0A6B2QUT1_9BURK|nr:3-methyl-2-oxobutanoate hydroxymethyltransferase [Sheuella amnicola]NDY82406.1 3-methyl-2-oxobutanoate hydroxymethyltransferase [Sheuella amnicola]
MSTHAEIKRVTVPQLRACKGQRKIAALTAHNFSTARIIDEYLDFILIGDSTAMVAYGLPNTLSITLEQIAQHTAAVVRATKHACIVADMPFGTYQESLEQAFRNAAYLVSHGADAVKLEGGAVMAPTIEFLVARGIPVLAHVGLMPQYVNTMGGYLAQGKTPDAAARILGDAKAHEQAGAFGVVLEGVAEALGTEITEQLSIPTIGIGASVSCDGQILVTEDMLGLSGERVPKFVKRYANLEESMRSAVQRYADEVRASKFPEPQHCFAVKRS